VVILNKFSLLLSKDHMLRLLVPIFSVFICGILLQFYISLKICILTLAMMLSANLQSGNLELDMETSLMHQITSLCQITFIAQKTQSSL